MPRLIFLLPALALAAPLAAQDAGGFQLPPNPSPTPTARPQGPVDEEAGPVPVRPRAIPTAAATPTPRPTATPTLAPEIVLPTAAPTPSASRAPQVRAQERPVTASAGGSASAPAAQGVEAGPAPVATAPAQPIPPASVDLPAPQSRPSAESGATSANPEGESGTDWTLLLAALGAIVAIAGGLLVWRRRSAARPPAEIERPVVAAPLTPAAIAPAEALTLKAEAVRFTRSFAFATVDYQLTVINRTNSALSGLEVGVDVISAHAGAPVESQLAGQDTAIEVHHHIERLGPNKSLVLRGEARLSLADVHVIHQGRTPLLVPLMRVRVAQEGDGAGALVRTLVVGQGLPGSGGRVQPFNLTDTPRAYHEVAQRELA